MVWFVGDEDFVSGVIGVSNGEEYRRFGGGSLVLARFLRSRLDGSMGSAWSGRV